MSEGRRRRAARGGRGPDGDAAEPNGSTAGTGSRTSRREALEDMQRADQERVRRRALRIGVPVAIALLVVLALVLAVVRPGGGGSGSGGDDEREQRTLLVQLVPTVGQPAAANAVVAVGPAAFLTIPGQLVVEVPGRGSVPLADTVRDDAAAGGVRAQQALVDGLDVLVDGSWVLDGPALAALVDGAGGVTVDVDTDVQVVQGGSRVRLLTEGPAQRLDGRQAVAFATYQAEGEPVESQLARFVDVLRETLAALPADDGDVEERLAGLTGSTSTFGDADLAGLLVGLGDAVRDDTVAYPALPVIADEIDGTTTYRLDVGRLEDALGGPFADSRPPTPAGGTVEVMVQNGVGTAGLLEAARARLVEARLSFESGGNANRFGYERTLVVIPDDSEESVEHGRLTADALGVPQDAVVIGDEAAGVADVVVVLGADFRP